jgi:hypothetical protein
MSEHVGPTAQGIALAATGEAGLLRGSADSPACHLPLTRHCPAAGVFAGAALFVSTVEVPAAADTGTAFHYAFFPHMYKR